MTTSIAAAARAAGTVVVRLSVADGGVSVEGGPVDEACVEGRVVAEGSAVIGGVDAGASLVVVSAALSTEAGDGVSVEHAVAPIVRPRPRKIAPLDNARSLITEA